jgi:TPP-dependent pyruvate/acetoin dehydrogenase alpha subunit
MDTLNQHDEATQEKLSFDLFRNEVLKDYKTCCISRETSLLGRKEVLTGKAKFGIFGDGKEVAQVAMAKFFRNGDFRSGYYRDQAWPPLSSSLRNYMPILMLNTTHSAQAAR